MPKTMLLSLALLATACSASPPQKPSPGAIWQDPASGLTFCYCPPGTFWMGTVEEEPYQVTDQKPRHLVTLTHGFWLGQSEVTRAQWQTFMGKPSVPAPTEDFSETAQSDHMPVTMVSWEDCQVFLKVLNRRCGYWTYRLPTEAEWEYACEAGKPPQPDQAWGTLGQALRSGDPENDLIRNAWGFINMLGPTREWCSDWGGPYSSGATMDPQGPTSGRYRVNRGGYGYRNRHIHPTWRWFYTPDFKDDDLGFRVVRVVE